MSIFQNIKSRILAVPSKRLIKQQPKLQKYIPNITYARVASVYDGDTITIAVTKRYFFKSNRIYAFKVRIARIDCPEIRGSSEDEKKVALIAKEFVRFRLEDQVVKLQINGYDKYGRLLAEVFYKEHAQQNNLSQNILPNLFKSYSSNLSDELLKANLAVEYKGGTKEIVDWKTKYGL